MKVGALAVLALVLVAAYFWYSIEYKPQKDIEKKVKSEPRKAYRPQPFDGQVN